MWNISLIHFSSVQLLSRVSLWTHGLQHTRLSCPSPTPGACSNSSSQWCPPTISSSVVPFSSCLRSFPTSGSFPRSQFFASGDQSIGVSASTSVFPMNSEDWFPLGLTGFKAMVFPVVMYGCESWTTKKAEHRRTDAFELWWYILVNTYWVSDSFWVLDYLFVQDK